MTVAVVICIIGLLLYVIFSHPKSTNSTVSTIGYVMFCVGLFWWVYEHVGNKF